MKPGKAFGVIASLLLLADLASSREIRVSYLSSENVYIDAGTADSLAIGDSLAINRSDSLIAEIEIIFLADHSASCKIVTANGVILSGDKAESRGRRAAVEATIQSVVPAPDTLKSAEANIPAVKTATRKPETQISGSASFLLYYFNDTGPDNLDFRQPGLGLNIKASRLWGSNFGLALRSSSRYNQRSRRYLSSIPQNEWRNRIYLLALSYAGEDSPLSFALGRVLSNNISGIGYIDGCLFENALNENLKLGGFAGTQPQWQYSKFQTSLQKYGAYANYSRGDRGGNRWESTLALAGEYHKGTVSREFLYLQNRADLRNRWSLFQSAELDVNRGWRKAKANSNLALTSIYMSLRGHPLPWLSTGISYDKRRNYWTYEIRSLADSLFDSARHSGFRADVSIRFPGNYFAHSNFGYNKRSGDTRSAYSYGFGLNKSDFMFSRLFINLQAGGFSNRFANGYEYSLRLGRYLRGGDNIAFSYGTYSYDFKAVSQSRINKWVRGEMQFDMATSLYLSGQYERDFGDDAKGHRILGEMGYRF